MKVTFFGRRSIQWVPTPEEFNALVGAGHGNLNVEVGAALGDINAVLHNFNAEINIAPLADPRFLDYLRDEINKPIQEPQNLSPTARIEKRMWSLAILNIALDPTASILTATPEPYILRFPYEVVLYGLIGTLSAHTSAWLIGRGGRGPPREYADVKAQREVPTFYNNRCLLTGTMKPQGAHIIPVRAKAVNRMDTWNTLSMFWPLPEVETLDLHGRERENILPLTHTVHDMWDSFHFGIRPIEHPTNPQHHLYIQMVWLIDMNGDRVESDWSHAGFGSASDYRRGSTPNFPAVQHGDVYELETDNPTTEPLPSLHFLHIQYAIHKIMAGIRAAGSLRELFNDDPPSDVGGYGARVDNIDDINDIADIDVPPMWQPILEAAVNAGVLTKEKALLWGKAFSKEAKDKAEADAEAEAELANLGDNKEANVPQIDP
ncbi:hypothetical protein CMQ_8295 [Grosmannia clavigera kw1407]|uniref:HNH nuclease domain-containing protein n=1 Tax=Grosmannia clavigera (strain kw1407 / UAMH 11150) TaxID=655863 RepID=F0XL21_GROCL|nr:uncharacterized protein CMQ_8295 [Grosmannia clavigera kw1407]EFX01829.1 hypothetical protein CMQ_8295 [Grosmannia clavigera kw1407]